MRGEHRQVVRIDPYPQSVEVPQEPAGWVTRKRSSFAKHNLHRRKYLPVLAELYDVFVNDCSLGKRVISVQSTPIFASASVSLCQSPDASIQSQ
jgi:hypothetical protein